MDKDSSIEAFLDRLVEEKGIADIDPEALTKVKDELRTSLADYINLGVLEKIPDNKLGEFERLIDENNIEGLKEFTNLNVPDIESVISDAIIRFGETYLGK